MMIREMFTSPDGDISSKRVLSAILIISGVVCAFVIRDWQITSVLVGGGVTILTAQAISKT